MRLFTSFVLALSFAISFVTPSLGHVHQAKRHHIHRQGDLARRDPGHVNIYKRQAFSNARLTYYQVGLGACGTTSQSSDFIVALNSEQYNGGQYCFQQISITCNGQTTTATIVDECPGCPYPGLDLSEGLFQFFASLSAGVLTATWEFADSGGSSPSPSPSSSPPPPPPPPPTTSTSVAVPLTTWLPSPTTTSQPTSMATSSSSTTSSNPIVSSSTTGLAPTQTTTNVAAESSGAVMGGSTNSSVLDSLNLSLSYVGQFLAACDGLE